ncbi:hypothetical protein BKP45_07785 [Anaerobacillus alkalidiazotrophicus]|uniref:DUF262 domain-containing protein n=1 Tax=Anaerobacillus alkalidiazotrophicus TaxID=472963 RepID=A0A1S2M8Q0_9BACI|nr:DUF262 domain-containing protein [Anaerobacillus alkalidiazotrophicus]OIJ20900.1 hypothetical protein BKP45_07785 [Anaerobacillus alkalidiazotrophicus]
MTKNEIDAKKSNINTIFSDFWFVVPEYQRAYVWDNDQVNELLDDLWFAFENKKDSEYFLGSLVLKNLNNNNFNEYEILDGQQRLTTLFLLMGVIRDSVTNNLLVDFCSKNIYQEENPFAGVPARKRIVYKIRGEVDEFINTYIKIADGTKKVTELEEISKESDHLTIKNMANSIVVLSQFFDMKNEAEITEFAQFLFKKVVFIYVSTENREDAFRLFTILNNRGLPLTSSDILKSINIGAIEDENESNLYAKSWEEMEGQLDDEFDRFLSFVRTIIVKDKARSNLLDEFEEKIYGKHLLEKGKPTIDLLKKYKLYYDKLLNFETSEITNEYKNLITIMLIGLPSRDWIPPLFYYYAKYGKEHLTAFLKRLENKFTGDWITQLTPTQRIENMNKILKQIESTPNPEELVRNDELFTIDKEYLRQILSRNVYGRRFARYILLKYEFLISDHTVHLSDYKTISVEHIMPQNPKHDSTWVQVFTEEERKEWVHKLGNLTLISMKKNTQLNNLDFVEKKKRYLEKRIDVFSGSKIFIQTSDDWKIDTIKNRQLEMIGKLVNDGY